MSAARIVALLVAAAMLVGGGLLAFAGMGYLGDSGRTSQSWAVLGSLLAGLGVALAITLLQRRER